jgi:hypothetical protein
VELVDPNPDFFGRTTIIILSGLTIICGVFLNACQSRGEANSVEARNDRINVSNLNQITYKINE